MNSVPKSIKREPDIACETSQTISDCENLEAESACPVDKDITFLTRRASIFSSGQRCPTRHQPVSYKQLCPLCKSRACIDDYARLLLTAELKHRQHIFKLRQDAVCRHAASINISTEKPST
jgi:hypothetical protein